MKTTRFVHSKSLPSRPVLRLSPLVAVVLLGCASQTDIVQGGSLLPYSQLSPKVEQVYTTGPCSGRNGNLAQGADGVEYELRREGGQATLYEHSLNEQMGRLLDNSWNDHGALHYFVWLSTVRGFEYVIPIRKDQPAERRIYADFETKRTRENGRWVVRPVGQQMTVCRLIATR